MIASAELSFHILRHSVQILAEDDLNSLFDLGFSIEEIQAIATLTVKELNHLGRLGGRFLEVKVDHQRLTRSLAHVRREAAAEALQDELLRLRAPAAMMRALFGTTSMQYANRRKLLGLSGVGVGRPAVPCEETEQAIWKAWRQQAHLSDGERYRATAKATRLPLSVIWTVLRAWEAETRTCSGVDRGSMDLNVTQKRDANDVVPPPSGG
jgi:hypothetical protein